MSDVVRYSSGAPWEERVGYSRAVAAGDLVFVAGTTATVEGVVQHEGDAHAQTLIAFGIVADALAQAGCSLADVVQTRMYLVDTDDQHGVGRAHAELFGAVRPAATMLAVAGFVDPGMLVEVEAVAYRPTSSSSTPSRPDVPERAAVPRSSTATPAASSRSGR